MQANQGYDNASGDRGRDDLDRWRFALDIVDVIVSTPPDWSARIGLFGAWGSGKSTVLRFLAESLQNSAVVINFNPAVNTGSGDVMGAFGEALIQGLVSKGLYVEPKAKTLARKSKWLYNKGTSSIVESASGFFSGAKVVSASLAAVTNWLRPDGEQIRRIAERVPSQRIVVLIDDIDRCPKEMLPTLFLSLRELLDLPRFTFVLAFDDGIVSSTLALANPAWGPGQQFLEKILDFRFTLPQIDGESKRNLIERAMKERAPFVLASSYAEVEDLIPDNPREIKALIRGLAAMKPVLSRHASEEFNWVDIWLVQILRQASQGLFDRLGDETVYNDLLGMHYHLLADRVRRGQRIAEDEDKTRQVLASLNLATPAQQQRVNEILEALRARGSMRLRYAFTLALKPPAVTWKEFFEMFTAWSLAPAPATLDRLMKDHATARSDSLIRVQGEVIKALSDRLDEDMGKAMRSRAVQQYTVAYSKVTPLYDMVQSFFGIPDLLTAERFKCFYDKAQYFRAVDRAGAEHEVRVREEADLLALARRLSPHEALKVFEELQPLYEGFFEPEDGQTPRRVLRDGICGLLRPVVDAQLCEFLAGENVVRRLREPKRFDVFKALLFGRRFLPWPPSVRSALFQLSASAEAEDSKNDEAELLFELLIDVIGYKDQLFDFQGAQQVLKDTEFVGRLWDTVSSRDLLPQGELYLLAVRAKFLQLGTSPDAMPLDDGLARQLSERSSEIDQIAGKL